MQFSFLQEEKLPPVLQRPTPSLRLTLFSHLKPTQLDLSDDTLFQEKGSFKLKSIRKFRQSLRQSQARNTLRNNQSELLTQQQQQTIIIPPVSSLGYQSESTADNSIDENSKTNTDYCSAEDSIQENSSNEFNEEHIIVVPNLEYISISLKKQH